MARRFKGLDKSELGLLTVRIESEYLTDMRRLAVAQGSTMSEEVRQFIYRYVEKYRDDN